MTFFSVCVLVLIWLFPTIHPSFYPYQGHSALEPIPAGNGAWGGGTPWTGQVKAVHHRSDTTVPPPYNISSVQKFKWSCPFYLFYFYVTLLLCLWLWFFTFSFSSCFYKLAPCCSDYIFLWAINWINICTEASLESSSDAEHLSCSNKVTD